MKHLIIQRFLLILNLFFRRQTKTNVISQNQRRKIRGFGDFKRIAVVFIPDDEEYKQRLEKKLENEGKEVSEYSSDDMKGKSFLLDF